MSEFAAIRETLQACGGSRIETARRLGISERTLRYRLAKAREGQRSSGSAAMQTFELSRPTVGSQAIGIARAAYEYALEYAKGRETFGRPIIDNQSIAFTLADMKTKIDAATLTKLEDHGNVEHDHAHGGEEHAEEDAHAEDAHSGEEHSEEGADER